MPTILYSNGVRVKGLKYPERMDILRLGRWMDHKGWQVHLTRDRLVQKTA